jgi:hypothetical protein
MSTTLSTPVDAPVDAPVAGRVTPARVFRSEWIKFRSLRSTWASIAAIVVITVGMGLLVSAFAAAQPNAAGDPVAVAGRAELGNLISQLAVGVLAVLLISGEYGTGTIRSTMTAVPRRMPVMWAKLGVFVVALFPLTLLSSAAAFVAGQVVWRAHGRNHVWFGDPGVDRIVAGAALSLVVSGLCAFAIGVLVRNTAAAVTTVVGLFFVLPTLMPALPEKLADVGRFLPLNAGGALWNTTLTSDPLSPWTGFALLCCYAVALLTAAAWRLGRGDV